MSELDQVLDCDSDNPAESRRVLAATCPDGEEAVESCVLALRSLRTALFDLGEFDEHQGVLESWADEVGLKGPEAEAFLRDAVLIGDAGDSTTDAKVSLHGQVALMARAHLSLRVERDLLFAVSDLLRLRLSSATGYMRPVAECFAQMVLLAQDPTMGEEWFASASRGKAFHDRWHSRVVGVIKELGIHGEYLRASNLALHSRSSGTAMGTLLGHKRNPTPGKIELAYQETDDPRILVINFGLILALYRKALQHGRRLYPELEDAIADTDELKRFLDLERKVWSRVLQAHSDLVQSGFTKALVGDSA